MIGSFGAAPPLCSYGSQIYPEVPAALAVVLAVATATGTRSRWNSIGFVLAITALPWLSIKYLPVAFTIFLLASLTKDGTGKKFLSKSSAIVFVLSKSKHLLKSDGKVPYTLVDSKKVVEYDKKYTRGSALTVGKNINDTTSMFLNLGLDINTNNKLFSGESDVLSSSLSYFKILGGNHYISPYVYWSKPNFRRQEDYETIGYGINNTFFLNEKNNINYGLSYSDTSYVSTPAFDEAKDKDNGVYSSFIRHNYNFSKNIQLGTKLIYNKTESIKECDSLDSRGLNISYSHVLPFGRLKLSSTYLKNDYEKKDVFVSSKYVRNDESLLTAISLDGQLNQLLPFLRKFNKDNSIFYTLNMRQSDVSSNILNHDIERNYKTISLTKRINLNELF